MQKVGITGGIGSGKSWVCNFFKILGVPVFYADIQSRMLLYDNSIKIQLKEVAGGEIFIGDKIDKKVFASVIFNNKEILIKTNRILHEGVKRKFIQWSKWQRRSPYGIIEAAVLFESESNFELDKIITVFAPEELRIERVIQREQTDRESIIMRMQHQLPEDEKIKKSDFVIYNDERNLLIPQILNIHKSLVQQSTI